MVDRGPRIKQVLDFVFNRENTFLVLGNHEACFIDWFRPGGDKRNKYMLKQGLSQTFWQLGSEAVEYAMKLSSYPYVIYDENKEFVLCHADYNWNEPDFKESHVWHRITASTHENYEGPVIIHGHTIVPTSKMIEKKDDGSVFGINLDGGAYTDLPGACLRCLRLDDMEFFEVPSLDNLKSIKK